MLKKFREHPNSINETYKEHFTFAVKTGIDCIVIGCYCFAHALFPWKHETTASQKIKQLSNQMKERTSND